MRINLLPDIVQQRRKDARTKQLATMALAGWFGLLAVVVLGTLAYRGFQNHRFSSATDTYDQVNADVNSDENVAIRAEAQSVQTSLLSLSTLHSSQAKLSVISRLIADKTPPKAKLKDLTITASGALTFTGDAPSYDDASIMVAAMKATADTSALAASSAPGYFTKVFLDGVNRTDGGTTFSISGVYVTKTGVSK